MIRTAVKLKERGNIFYYYQKRNGKHVPVFYPYSLTRTFGVPGKFKFANKAGFRCVATPGINKRFEIRNISMHRIHNLHGHFHDTSMNFNCDKICTINNYYITNSFYTGSGTRYQCRELRDPRQRALHDTHDEFAGKLYNSIKEYKPLSIKDRHRILFA